MGNLLETLIELGDLLDATDDVEEENFVGFNKADKSRWPKVRDTNDPAQVMNLLYKYQEQMKSRFPNLMENISEWKLTQNASQELRDITAGARKEREQAERLAKAEQQARLKAEKEEAERNFPAKVILIPENGVLRATNYDLLQTACKKKFWDIIGIHKNLKPNARAAQVNRNWVWYLKYTVDFIKYRKDLEAIGVELEMPVIDESLLNKKIPDVKVELRSDGSIAVRHEYHNKLNLAYKNAEETTSIIGFDWTEKCRVVGKNEFYSLDEVLSAIKKYEPNWFVEVSPAVEDARKKYEEEKTYRRRITDDVTRKLNPNIVPLPYQIEGYRYYELTDGNSLNGDDMGLGKTFQTLLYAANYDRRTLVVAPKNVRRQWIEETRKFFKPGVFTCLELDSKLKVENFNGYNLVTCNYEILKKFEQQIAAEGFDLLVLDESHRIKDPKAQITQLIQRLAPSFKRKICLSGTPIKNKKKEIYTQAVLIKPEIFKSQSEVNMMTFFDCKEKMKEFFFRRTKKEELKDLPPKLRQVVKLDCSEKLPDYKPGMEIGEISTLNSELACAKAPMTIDFVQEILDNSDSKIIVFSSSDDAAQAIAEAFGELAVLHVGSTPHEKREKAKALYNDENSKVRIFVATIGSAREGLNLQIADKVVFNDLPWTPADVNQGEDRAWRLGQKVAVNVYWICAEGNEFDEGKVELIYSKMEVFDKLINAKKPTEEKNEKSMMQTLKELLDKKS